jgi:hypothetical protein
MYKFSKGDMGRGDRNLHVGKRSSDLRSCHVCAPIASPYITFN